MAQPSAPSAGGTQVHPLLRLDSNFSIPFPYFSCITSHPYGPVPLPYIPSSEDAWAGMKCVAATENFFL